MRPMLTKSKKVSLSISSWFCVPEQGMKDFEILCRASAFLVKSSGKTFQRKFHVCTASHVVAPWRFPKYYPDEWLQAVNHKHTHYTIELRHEDGVFQTQSDLIPSCYHHGKRDIAVLHIENEEEVTSMLSKFGLDGNELLLDRPLAPEEAVEFHGHEVIDASSSFLASNAGSGGDSQDQDLRLPVPRIVPGTFFSHTQHQSFVKTNPILTFGMCGGPAVAYKSATEKVPKICGLLEGIIPVEHPVEGLRGLASIVDSIEIAKFLASVEEGKVDAEIGGEAAEFVGSDQDPDKIGIESIMKKLD